MDLGTIQEQFSSDEQCLEYMEMKRWPKGVRCVECGSERVSRYVSSSKKQRIRRIYECLDCRQQFTATSGTIFHDTHLPLTKWFMAIALIVDAKKGMSAMQLQRHLHVSYKAAWYLAHRIRKAMEDEFQLFGTVEVDEAYIGGRRRGRIGRGAGKPPVVGLRQRGGKVKFVQAPNVKADTLYKIIRQHISPNVEMIVTDDYPSYPTAMGKQFRSRHRPVSHKMQFIKPDLNTNSVESAFSLLKRGIVGSFHRVSVKHLGRYLNEFEYRFNNRKNPTLFHDVVTGLLRNKGMMFKELVGSIPAAQA